jgi:hypothetical protein
MTANDRNRILFDANEEPPKRDWKTNIALLIGIIGLVSPIALWQYDLASTSISTKVVSSIPLVFSQLSTVSDIEVRLDGQTIANPYVSTITITNDGSKPIPTASFEAPLEFYVRGDVKVVRAKISKSEPPEISARIVSEEKSFRLEPLLLNQGDALKVVVITAGGPPDFKVKGRVNSIRKLELTDAIETQPGTAAKISSLSLFVLGALLYPLVAVGLARRTPLSPWTMLGLGLMAAITSTNSGKRAAQLFELERWPFIAFQLVAVVIILVWLLPGLRALIQLVLPRGR